MPDATLEGVEWEIRHVLNGLMVRVEAHGKNRLFRAQTHLLPAVIAEAAKIARK